MKLNVCSQITLLTGFNSGCLFGFASAWQKILDPPLKTMFLVDPTLGSCYNLSSACHYMEVRIYSWLTPTWIPLQPEFSIEKTMFLVDPTLGSRYNISPACNYMQVRIYSWLTPTWTPVTTWIQCWEDYVFSWPHFRVLLQFKFSMQLNVSKDIFLTDPNLDSRYNLNSELRRLCF